MALLVLDSSTVGVSPTPTGGFAIQLREIEGLPDGLTLLVPFEGDGAEEVFERISDCMGKTSTGTLATATPAQARQEAAEHGLDTAN